MKERDFAIICQGFALGLAFSNGHLGVAIGTIVLLTCSLIITIWRLR